MDRQPLVSVIIPTYNRAGVIQPTLDSVLVQTHPRLEVIVVDDGSTDRTAEVIAQYSGRVRYVRQENQGVEMARNRGIRAAQGDYLNFLDDDDVMRPDKIERQLALFGAHPEYGVVHCGYDYIDERGNWLETTGALPDGDVREKLAWGCFPWSGGPLIRRDCLNVIGEDEHRDWYGDWGMWLRLALAGYRFGCVQEPLGSYRIVSGSMTDSRVANAERLVLHILGEIFASGKLPDPAVAQKDAIYAGWHIWIACRYYTGEYWTEAVRNVAEALTRQPDFLRQPDELLQLFYWDAMSPRGRVGDPARFINGVFDHLPLAAAFFQVHRSDVLSRVYIGLALHSYGAGRLEEGRDQMAEALRLRPTLLDQPDVFVRSVHDYAARQRFTSALEYVNAVLQNLPPGASGLERVRRSALGEMNAARAFQEYELGHRRRVPGRVLAAVYNRPELLRNRGILSIFVRSLPALVHGDDG